MEALESLRFFSVVVPSYTKQTLPNGMYGGLPADWDRDGDLDLIASIEGELWLIQRQGNGSYSKVSAGAAAQNQGLAAAVDLDRDGDLDLISVTSMYAAGPHLNQILWQLNDGAGHFGVEVSLPIPALPASVLGEDLDRDGFADLVVNYTDVFTTRGTVIFLNDRAGGFTPSTTLDGTGFDSSGSSAAADFDGDGDTDLAIPVSRYQSPSIDGVIRVLKNNGSGQFEFFDDIVIGGKYTRTVYATDVDDDGDIDLITSRADYTIADPRKDAAVVVLRNDGTGHFPQRQDLLIPANPGAYDLVGDLNGDSAVDVLATSKLLPFWNDVGGLFAIGTPYVTSDNEYGYTLADLDGDGRRDIFTGSAMWLASGFTDTLRPVASRPAYVYNPQAGSPALRIDFSEDVLQTLRAADFQLTNLTTGQPIPAADLKLNYSTGDIASLLLPNTLPDGNYRLTIAASAVADIAGNTLASDFTFDFAVLSGDANRDRKIDAVDLAILSANWQGTSKTFSQGDFNYDSKVDIQDLYILASKWQQALPPPALPSIPASATLSRRTPVRMISVVP